MQPCLSVRDLKIAVTVRDLVPLPSTGPMYMVKLPNKNVNKFIIMKTLGLHPKLCATIKG